MSSNPTICVWIGRGFFSECRKAFCSDSRKMSKTNVKGFSPKGERSSPEGENRIPEGRAALQEGFETVSECSGTFPEGLGTVREGLGTVAEVEDAEGEG